MRGDTEAKTIKKKFKKDSSVHTRLGAISIPIKRSADASARAEFLANIGRRLWQCGRRINDSKEKPAEDLLTPLQQAQRAATVSK